LDGCVELEAAALLSGVAVVAGAAEVAGAADEDCEAAAFWSVVAAEDEASDEVAGCAWAVAAGAAALSVLGVALEALELLQVSATDFTLVTL
jgi:hypothetical protein